ncbi:uncharacterized protein B0H18DRAFT_39325 [Fomitopsis serialis]|uniref:uncharacterized protein n=1 Tax=Fomitopsis serialis TaxID=139415 RepID=UPI0020079B51|nr:uncharacterized protein B0H18DRAFT_39325 [Neoantrodia serialis]KAH9917347.1 hypothetical protein B0H18DRAFT_39325 [Neoantrodia serialis]
MIGYAAVYVWRAPRGTWYVPTFVATPDGDLEVVVEPPPTYSFYHDLESVFWIFLCTSISRSGPAMRREALWNGTDTALANKFYQLIQALDNSQLAENKQAIMTHNKAFLAVLCFVDDYYKPLTRLLRRLWNILNPAYESRNFVVNDMYNATLAAFEQTEEELQDTPEDLTPEQKKALDRELARRDADLTDWEHSPRPAVPHPHPPRSDTDTDDQDDDTDEESDSSPPSPRDSTGKDRNNTSLKSQPTPQAVTRKTSNAAVGRVTRSMARRKAEQGSSRAATPRGRTASRPSRRLIRSRKEGRRRAAVAVVANRLREDVITRVGAPEASAEQGEQATRGSGGRGTSGKEREAR